MTETEHSLVDNPSHIDHAYEHEHGHHHDHHEETLDFSHPAHEAHDHHEAEHVCSSECEHHQHEADHHAEELFNDAETTASHEHDHVCASECQHHHTEADEIATELFAVEKDHDHEHHHHEQGHVCSSECEHHQHDADNHASALFEEAEEHTKHQEIGHVCSSECSHHQTEADHHAEELFAEETVPPELLTRIEEHEIQARRGDVLEEAMSQKEPAPVRTVREPSAPMPKVQAVKPVPPSTVILEPPAITISQPEKIVSHSNQEITPTTQENVTEVSNEPTKVGEPLTLETLNEEPGAVDTELTYISTLVAKSVEAAISEEKPEQELTEPAYGIIEDEHTSDKPEASIMTPQEVIDELPTLKPIESLLPHVIEAKHDREHIAEIEDAIVVINRLLDHVDNEDTLILDEILYSEIVLLCQNLGIDDPEEFLRIVSMETSEEPRVIDLQDTRLSGEILRGLKQYLSPEQSHEFGLAQTRTVSSIVLSRLQVVGRLILRLLRQPSPYPEPLR